MEPINITGTKTVPSVKFDSATGILEIKGKSIISDASSFYRPLISWIENYSKSPQEITTVNFNLDYYSTSSLKTILELLNRLDKIYSSGSQVIINWHYDKEFDEMRESGEDFNNLVKVPINVIKY